MTINAKQQNMLNKIDQAITNLKRAKTKLSISKIAEKANIARKTIYNHPFLRERCEQAIKIQLEQNRSLNEVSASLEMNRPLSGKKLLEERYKKIKEKLKIEQEKNAKLLENNRKLVLEKALLKNKIEILQSQIEQLRGRKIRKIK